MWWFGGEMGGMSGSGLVCYEHGFSCVCVYVYVLIHTHTRGVCVDSYSLGTSHWGMSIGVGMNILCKGSRVVPYCPCRVRR